MIYDIKKTEIRLLEENGKVFLEQGLLIEGDGLYAIYSKGTFDFVCTEKDELNQILASENLILQEIAEERHCSQCNQSMQEGFYFESDGTQYCNEECLTKVISWGKYLEIYDYGNGDAYWTAWEDN